MRMSCNGCRVLRKGCSENCSIRPCLQWIKNPESQANATVFLAKFFGRAGLMNLINAGPEHLRPAIFRSLLYEACGRILNPIYGSVGLLGSGSWQLCQEAVEAVLKGVPITPITTEAAASGHGPPLKAYDIRHVSKDENSAESNDPGQNRVKRRCRFRRSVVKPNANKANGISSVVDSARGFCADELSHHSDGPNESKESESMVSMETASALFRAEPESVPERNKDTVQESGLGLELTLGLEPVSSRGQHVVPVKKRRMEASTWDTECCKMELGLDLPA